MNAFPTLDEVVADMKADMTPAERVEWDEAQTTSDAETKKWAADYSLPDAGKLNNAAPSRTPSPEGAQMAYQVHVDPAGRYRWRLVAPNGEIIVASSESYATEAECLNVIDIVKGSISAPVVAA